MKLLNVPPVKPGQKFKVNGSRSTYSVDNIAWSHVWQEWEVSATIVQAGSFYPAGASIVFMLYSDDVVEILND